MIARIAASLAFISLSLATSFAADRPSPGNPPAVLIAQQIDDAGNLVLLEYRTIFIQPAGPLGGGGPLYNERVTKKVSLKEVNIYTKDGDPVSLDDARKKLGNKETAIVVSSWGHRLSPTYKSIFRENILLFAFPKEAPQWKEIQAPEMPVRD